MTDSTGGRTAEEINRSIRYTGYSVYRAASMGAVPGARRREALTTLVQDLTAQDVVVRGFYDVSGLRSDADLMIWWHAPAAEQLQQAARTFERGEAGRGVERVWSAYGVHRTAEFNRSHIPAFLAGFEPKGWVSVYPFVRSYEWYLLPEVDRREMLREHGVMGRDYDQVLANTVAAFSLGDYEWLLALEADDLHDIVDLMRHLRGSKARLHVREEVPFYTGRRIGLDEVVEVLG